jgi:hypothetical protein
MWRAKAEHNEPPNSSTETDFLNRTTNIIDGEGHADAGDGATDGRSDEGVGCKTK